MYIHGVGRHQPVRLGSAQHRSRRQAQGKASRVEQVLRNGPILIETEIDENSGEERITEIGHTDTGRILFVVWTLRRTSCRPVTAYAADPKTRALYIGARFRKDYE